MKNNLILSDIDNIEFLFYCSIQMNKAGVLRKAIEMIQRLQNENGRLKQENITLKMEQQKRGTTFTTLLFITKQETFH